MILTLEFASSLDVSLENDVLGTLDIETQDLYDAVVKARAILSSNEFGTSVDGFRVVANRNRVIYIEHRGTSDVAAPLPDAYQASRWTIRSGTAPASSAVTAQGDQIGASC